MPPVVKALLILNILFFVADFVTRPGPVIPQFGKLNMLGCFTVKSAFMEGRVWEFLTFQFLHASIGHILFNGFGLYVFGPGWSAGGAAGASRHSTCSAALPGPCSTRC